MPLPRCCSRCAASSSLSATTCERLLLLYSTVERLGHRSSFKVRDYTPSSAHLRTLTLMITITENNFVIRSTKIQPHHLILQQPFAFWSEREMKNGDKAEPSCTSTVHIVLLQCRHPRTKHRGNLSSRTLTVLPSSSAVSIILRLRSEIKTHKREQT
mgnify:CR=1 FL=1